MSKDISELRERAESGELADSDVAYLNARQGIPAYDSIRQAANEADFTDETEDDGYEDMKVDELKAELDEREIEYDGDARKADLVALLREDDEEA